jgi:membrane protein implicated in regulation of membrane protease activity
MICFLSLSLAFGISAIIWGVADAGPNIVWLGVAIMSPCVLLAPMAVTRAIKDIAGNKKDRALREPGTVGC